MSLPDDGRMDLADTVTIGNAISAMISPAFKQAAICLNLVHAETCPDNTNVIKFRKSGSLVAEAVAEGAVYLPTDANSDINDTSVTATATKVMVSSPISREAQRFGAGAAAFPRVAAEQGRALGRKFDADFLALISSLTNNVTASTTLDTDSLLTAQYNIYNSLTPPGPLVALLHFKGVLELQKLVVNAGAAVWTNAYSLPLVSGVPAANNFKGNFLGIDVYQTTGFGTTGGDNIQVVFNPEYAFCAALGGNVQTEIYYTGNGVASQVPGVSDVVQSYMYYDVKIYNDTAACKLRSDS